MSVIVQQNMHVTLPGLRYSSPSPAAVMLCDVTVCAALQCGIQPRQHLAPSQPVPSDKNPQVHRRSFVFFNYCFHYFQILMVHYYQVIL